MPPGIVHLKERSLGIHPLAHIPYWLRAKALSFQSLPGRGLRRRLRLLRRR